MSDSADEPFIDPIEPLDHILPHIPTAEGAKTVSSWYRTEEMTLNFGEYVGRPSANIQAHTEQLSALFQEGWYVTEVSSTGEDGEWEKVRSSTESSTSTKTGTVSASGTSEEASSSESTATQDSQSQSSSTATSEGESSSSSANNSSNNSSASSSSDSTTTSGYNTWMGRDSSRTAANGTSSASGSSSSSVDSNGTTSNTGTETATGTSTSNGTESATGTSSDSYNDEQSSTESTSNQAESEVTEAGDPYYCSYAYIKLQRKRMQSDLVLQSMIDSLIGAYNNGRSINVARYDEIVSLYALMLSRTEDEGNAMIDDGIDFTPLFDDIKTQVQSALTTYASQVTAIPSTWMQSRIDEINRKFNALLGQEMAKYTTAGMWNTTISASVNAGIERERQYALNQLSDEMVSVKLKAYGDIATITANVGDNLIQAQVRIFEALQKKRIEPVNLRNTVFKWMLDFMERREDPYPQITELETVAERLGYSGGIAYPERSSSSSSGSAGA